MHIPVKVNGDLALFRGLAKSIISGFGVDFDFIADYTHGYNQYEKSVSHTSWDEIVSTSGVSRHDIEKLASAMRASKSTIVCWAMGLTQHHNSVATIQEIVNTLLLGCHIGRPGAGLCPVRGHSNVQGDRTVGINHKPSNGFLSSLRNTTGIVPPTNHGYDSVASVLAMIEGDVKVFLSMGGNFVSAMSDTHSTSKGIQNCELTVQISTKPNRSHLVTGKTALILPCLGRTEKDVSANGNQFVTVENSMGVVHSSLGTARPASNLLRSEPSIVAGIAIALDGIVGDSRISWAGLSEDYDSIRNMIESAIPGFDSYNERVREPSGFYLPNPPRDSRTFNTDTGRANFRINPISVISPEQDLSLIHI